MSIDTVHGIDIGSELRYQLSDTGTVQTFSDNELSSHVSWAVREYSNYRPYSSFYSFTTTVNSYSYSLPDGVIDLAWHNYTYVGDLVITDSAQLDWLYLTGQLRDDALRFVRDEWQARWQNLTGGQVRIIDHSWAWLFPTPSDSFTVSFELLFAHTPTYINPYYDYPTVPLSDAEIIKDLALSRCLEVELDEMLRQGTWKVGQTEIQRQVEVMRKRADTVRLRAIKRVDQGSIVMVQSG